MAARCNQRRKEALDLPRFVDASGPRDSARIRYEIVIQCAPPQRNGSRPDSGAATQVAVSPARQAASSLDVTAVYRRGACSRGCASRARAGGRLVRESWTARSMCPPTQLSRVDGEAGNAPRCRADAADAPRTDELALVEIGTTIASPRMLAQVRVVVEDHVACVD